MYTLSIKRHTAYVGFSLMLLMASTSFLACSSDDNEPEPLKPQLPATVGRSIVSVKHLGNMMTAYDWTFSYSDGRLVSASGTYRNEDETDDASYSYTSTLTYGSDYVNVANTNGDDISVQLNSQGYIERMTVNRNIYTFSYTDGRLSAWSKTAYENSFGQATQYRSSATIEYSSGNLSSIVYRTPDDTPVTLTFTPSSVVNTNGLLPETVSEQMGCLGFEHLYYAGLLGRPTVNLVGSVTVSGSKLADDYTIDFEYSRSGNDIVLCNYHTPQGGVTSASYGY